MKISHMNKKTVPNTGNELQAHKKISYSLPLIYTISLGIIFTALQAFEYANAPFSISDGIYGSIFYVATGFHGAHVLIGTIFLCVCLARLLKGHFTPQIHLGFEAAA